jgi:hypothetical protein
MPDILGPAAAGSSVAPTVRPTPPLPNVIGAVPTFFKDCTSVEASDGTEVTAAWLNAVTMQLRVAFQGMSILEDNADDMLLRAIQKAQQTSTSTALPLHNHDDRYFTEVESDDRYLRRDASSEVTAPNATTGFQNIRIGGGITVGYTSTLGWRQNGDAADSFAEFAANGQKYIVSYDGTVNAPPKFVTSLTKNGSMFIYGTEAALYLTGRDNSATITAIYTTGGAFKVAAQYGDVMSLKATEQTIIRSGVMRQIATEEKTDAGGAGILINGVTGAALDHSINKTYSIDKSWFDARYAVAPAVVVRQEVSGSGDIPYLQLAQVWEKVSFNVLAVNKGLIASIFNNEIFLPAGTYYARWSSVALGNGYMNSRLATGATSLVVGVTGGARHWADNDPKTLVGSGEFTLSALSGVRLDHMYEYYAGPSTPPEPVYFLSPVPKIHRQLEIWRLS